MRWLGALLLSLWLTASAWAQLTIDGSVSNNANPSTTLTFTLTTSNSNDVIVVDLITNGGPIVSVTATGLSFSKHSSTGASNGDLERWDAIASSALSAVTITATATSSAFFSGTAYGVSGANTSSPWDSGGPVTGAPDPLSITTANPNTMILPAYRMASTGSPTAGSGYTGIALLANSFSISEEKVVSATGTYSGTLTTGAGDANGGIIDAIVQASAAASCPLTRTLMGVGC